MAASTAPAAKTLHLSLFTYLFKHKVWLAGIGMVLLASVCQAIALATGPVALVQPIFIIELPFTLLVASRLARRKLPRTTWIAVALVTVSLGLGLAAAAPSGGGRRADQRLLRGHGVRRERADRRVAARRRDRRGARDSRRLHRAVPLAGPGPRRRAAGTSRVNPALIASLAAAGLAGRLAAARGHH